MSRPSERLRAARKQRYRNASEFARAIGWEVGTYRHKENGTRGISTEDARIFAARLGVSPTWLLLGEKSIDISTSGNVSPCPHVFASFLTAEEAKFILIGGRTGLLMSDEVIKTTIPVPTDRQNVVAFQMLDDSMARVIPSGSKIVIDMDDTEPCHDGIYALDVDGTLIVRRFRSDAIGARYETDSIARPADPLTVDMARKVIGRVIYVATEL